ncbi:putative phosphoglycerate mutase [Nocardiopsis arvandica]|uniref:Putative phosphoglycerate mutase n=1 Tax=Nocardiopsis sinuspersici TaxID=501010 RepID=A0A7Z0BJA3_9ACTN|nr:histidine phosphatase family protein [Nocardiopsis sinuspersici]NYH53583.1 putative phosphoglycerate mutase [Nocardiopsis sinuspersici]
MGTLILVRHAQAEDHETSDPALSDEGRRQAALLGSRLTNSSASAILHGSRRRARQTAEVVAELLHVPLQQTTLLEDRTPFPSLERWDDYPPHRWGFLKGTPEAERDINGEALAEAWRELTARSRDSTLIAVTHAFVVGSFVSHALDAPSDAWMKLPIANTSITELQYSSGEWSAMTVNDTHHLDSL